MTDAQAPTPRWRALNWTPVALVLLGAMLYLPTVSKGLVNTDNHAAAASAWRIAATGTPWMEGVAVNDLEGSSYPEMWLIESAHGHLVHNRTPGVVLIGVPFYWALNDDPAPADFKIWVGGVAAATVTVGAGLLLFFGLRSGVGDRGAFAGVCGLLFTTPVWSVAADALWTQSLTILAVAGAMWAASRSRWWLAGVLFGLGILGRAHVAVVAAVVGLYLGWRRRDWRIVIRTGLGSGLGVVVLALWNRAVFGSWSLRGGYGGYVVENLLSSGSTIFYHFANCVGFLMSPDRGLLVWTPVILVLLPSLLSSWKQLPDWVRAFVIGGIAYTVVQLRINSFVGGLGFYGYRLALELLVCITPALVYAYKATSIRTRYLLGGVLGLQFAAIAIGAWADQYSTNDAGLWQTNSYVLALSDRPVVYGAISALCVVTGVLITAASMRRHPTASTQPNNERLRSQDEASTN